MKKNDLPNKRSQEGRALFIRAYGKYFEACFDSWMESNDINWIWGYKCKECGKIYKNERSALKHIEKVHHIDWILDRKLTKDEIEALFEK